MERVGAFAVVHRLKGNFEGCVHCAHMQPSKLPLSLSFFILSEHVLNFTFNISTPV